MILEQFTETAVFDFGFDNLVELQSEYKPKVHEVFKDDDAEEYWYLDENDIWILEDKFSMTTLKTEYNWREMVVNYGPMVYVGIKSDFNFNEG